MYVDDTTLFNMRNFRTKQTILFCCCFRAVFQILNFLASKSYELRRFFQQQLFLIYCQYYNLLVSPRHGETSVVHMFVRCEIFRYYLFIASLKQLQFVFNKINS